MVETNLIDGTILVPLCGKVSETEVLRQAALAAKRNKAKLYVVHVIVVKQQLPLESEMPKEVIVGEKVLADAERIAHEHGVRIETGMLQARSAGVAIVEEATDRQADLIMMAVNFRTRLGEFNMGKTVPYVLKNAQCPVWIYRDSLNRIQQ
ncbi:MAG: universal stress protein [Chloroflexi bacterium]|uniref:Universal stress protein n=1 Tax=Candidatus Chlorohelix allophototropha TaxID=3003348 RepID=A0A8T7M5V3_9CHLR|nr:universal stress protein [Chloroflexota bacterium]WJW69355.1 universal stress protein [Chloroflexota bacterium L227-S17]